MVSSKYLKVSWDPRKAWLDLLCGSTKGRIKLFGMFMSREDGLVTKDVLDAFVADCVSHGAGTTDEALSCYSCVCRRDDKYLMLAAVNPTSIDATHTLVTTIDSLRFHQFILSRPKTIAKSVLPEKPESPSYDDEEAYRDALKRVTSSKGWYNAAGTLGRPSPDPIRVWFCESQGLDSEVGADLSSTTRASKVRDALGLIETRDGTYLLSIRVPAACLHTIMDLKMARPGFADEGNRRFAVRLDGAPEHVYQDMWGLTVHLGKLAQKSSTIHGVPERICSSVKLSQVGDLIGVDALGWVIGSRGEEIGVDDDHSFLDRLRGKWTVAMTIDGLLA